jgi:hypothetical protein
MHGRSRGGCEGVKTTLAPQRSGVGTKEQAHGEIFPFIMREFSAGGKKNVSVHELLMQAKGFAFFMASNSALGHCRAKRYFLLHAFWR